MLSISDPTDHSVLLPLLYYFKLHMDENKATFTLTCHIYLPIYLTFDCLHIKPAWTEHAGSLKDFTGSGCVESHKLVTLNSYTIDLLRSVHYIISELIPFCGCILNNVFSNVCIAYINLP